MRRRLLLVLLGLSLAALTGFAVPLLASTSAERTQRFAISRTADIDRFAELAGSSRDRLAAEVRAYVELYRDAVVVVDARHTPLVEAGLRAEDPSARAALDAALRNQPAAPPADLRPWSSGTMLFARPIGSGTRVSGAVLIRASVDRAAADVAAQWSLILSGALAVAAAFVALALLVARWVLRPVAELDRAVRAVGAGEQGAHVTRELGPPELRGLAGSVNRMSDAVAESERRQRALVADTSHQLRNPLAALRLRMDSLAGWVEPRGQGTYASMVAELERLESLLDGMLALASADTAATELAAGHGPETSCEARSVVADRIDAWSAAAADSGVELSIVESRSSVPVACADSELAQVLDAVLDNAVKYAAGSAVTVSVEAESGRARITVADTGPGVAETDLPNLTSRFWRVPSGKPGSGLGLAIADRLVTARGGGLVLRRGEPTGLTVVVDLPGGPNDRDNTEGNAGAGHDAGSRSRR
ncbi:sensor histidine kinase [Actinokineospora iranica]|uniref:histidine kinase n=1 Tax=Actinokineospora iranica TaxID=1271860 RepID=A0A1G6RZG6_9PSEU|nr:HAMP domain-containing sensor histidine kinase [Actinokineospora iranica]SDD10072.1 Signal transduction histidine kinase [Actinokineospora iranica]